VDVEEDIRLLTGFIPVEQYGGPENMRLSSAPFPCAGPVPKLRPSLPLAD
jgi:hypothetical protein